jgi:glycyl-tRNA synthetase
MPSNNKKAFPMKHGDVMELAIRRGFIWPSYEIYGGAGGFYDYGPLGATLKKKLEDVWRELYCIKEGFLEISSPSVSPEEVFIASGHVNSFVDPLVECKKCGSAFRADHTIQEAVGMKTDGLSIGELERIIDKNSVKCPKCGGGFGGVWTYNLMFKTHIGPGEKRVGYLRPETAQAMFVLFNRLYSFYRKKLPFGVAQLGRAYRNEISPRQGVIRLREFSQAEVEIFVDPREKTHKNFKNVSREKMVLVPQDGEEVKVSAADAVKNGTVTSELLTYHLLLTKHFLGMVGIPEERIRFRQHVKTEMAHYAADCWDAEFNSERFGWIEVVGIADRTCYDLEAHEKESGVELKAFRRFETPDVVEKEVLVPDEAKIGPAFKSQAKDIVEALKGLGEKEMEGFSNNGYIELEVGGEKIKLDSDCISLKKVEKTVAGEKITPHIIEPSYGIDRIIYCVLENAYSERDDKVVLNLKNSVAPVEVAIFPLVTKPELIKVAREVYEDLKASGFYSTYDEADSIGRRYARVDEIGVPYAITVDFDTLSDNSVTVRDRNTTNQIRIKLKDLDETLQKLLSESVRFEEL